MIDRSLVLSRFRAGEKQISIAKSFGVSRQRIDQILKKELGEVKNKEVKERQAQNRAQNQERKREESLKRRRLEKPVPCVVCGKLIEYRRTSMIVKTCSTEHLTYYRNHRSRFDPNFNVNLASTTVRNRKKWLRKGIITRSAVRWSIKVLYKNGKITKTEAKKLAKEVPYKVRGHKFEL